MQQKVSFLKSIRLWGIILLLILAGVLITIDISRSFHEEAVRIEQIRSDFVTQQRSLIKQEVEQVVKLIDFETEHIVQQEQEKMKGRVDKAYAISKNIYEKYRDSKSLDEIRKIIIETLRPVRFDGGEGYFFISGFNGLLYLYDDYREDEGTSNYDIQDSRGRYIAREMTRIAQESGEGFCRYYWTKPNSTKKDHQKISFIKGFEPLGWYIGTGIYLDAIEDSIHRIISEYVENHRFGPNGRGYVFILELLDINGGDKFAIMYANPNRPDLIGKYLSDTLPDAKGKLFRQEFLRGLREHGECYVDYWYKKFDNPDPSPKTSFFKLTKDHRFIVAAGVYLDDVEEKIVAMQQGLKREIKTNILLLGFAVVVTILFFIVIWSWISKKLKNDFNLFTDFFSQAAHSSKMIDRTQIKFTELDQMAEFANQMINDKMAAERALLDEREQLQVTLQSIVDGVITVDCSGQVVLMNRVAENLTGWTQAEASGKLFKDIFCLSDDGDDSESAERILAELTDAQSSTEYKKLLRSKEGSTYRIVVSSAPISGGGDICGTVVVFRDETQKLKNEEELFKAKKLESVGLLAGGIAHDFNNILAGLFGNIELAKRKIDRDHAAYSYIQVAHQALERATGLTQQLLTFAKGGDPVLEAVSIQQEIKDIVQFNLSGSSVSAKFDFSADLWPIKADKGQFGQVIANLTINAKHAMPMGGTLHVAAENIMLDGLNVGSLAGPYVKLMVRDEGVGMTADVVDKIFDPYFSTKQTGSGLGLAMVRSMIDKHHGRIDVASRPGEGTVFTIYLPAEMEGEGQAAYMTDPSVASMSGGRVLVVDDEAIVQNILVEMLEICGYSVDTAATGEAGWEKYLTEKEAGNRYDLVIMDLTIPGGMGGKAAALKILDIDPDARIIAASGYSTDPIMANYHDYGFVGRLLKPFYLADLQKEVSRVLTLNKE